MTATPGIFATDLDGTLLRNGKISEADRTAFERLGKAGVIRVIATGRSAFSLRRALPDDFPVDYLILSTGNQIIDCCTRSTLYEGTLYAREIRSIRDQLERYGLDYMLHDVFPDNHQFQYHRATDTNTDFDQRLSLYADVASPLSAATHIAQASQFVIIAPSSGAEITADLTDALQGVSIIRATSPLDDRSTWIEIFADGVNKSAGIRRIMDLHGLDATRIAAMGNDHNDSDMLDLARYAYITDAAFVEAPHYITVPVRDNTVALAVDHYLEQLRSFAPTP